MNLTSIISKDGTSINAKIVDGKGNNLPAINRIEIVMLPGLPIIARADLLLEELDIKVEKLDLFVTLNGVKYKLVEVESA